MSGRSSKGCNGKSIVAGVAPCASVLLSVCDVLAEARTQRLLRITGELGSLRWQQVPAIILAGGLVIVTLALLITYLLHKQTQLARVRSEQMRLSGMLINAQEEERKRLAAELHDDFSHRLALLSLSIENVAELVPPDCEQANELLHELLNSASELGADLHTLSHRLHSSTLEKLGLVPGVGAFCKEFAAQNQIPVTFSHRDVPRSVPPDVALCLFRVVQEALRNVKKHSGASAARVSLHRLNSHLHLAISDNGAGFDARDLDGSEGIGLLSMQERARLIGAQFAVYSEPQKGTHIDLWAPCAAQAESESSFTAEAHNHAGAAAGSRA